MVWKIGQVEDKKSFVPSIDKETGKQISIPVITRKLPIIHESGDQWLIQFNRRKYSIHYPASHVEIETRGYYRPSGTKEVANRETGLDAQSLVRRLVEKFGPKFARKVVMEFAGK